MPASPSKLAAAVRRFPHQWCGGHFPHGPQLVFLALEDVREVLFGGSAGGGKSNSLLMAALEYVDVPGYSAIIFRRTFADLALPEALMARSHEWLGGTSAKWDGNQHKWTFPSGATLQFGYMDTERHKYRYQSAAFQFCGFDELTQFPESQYRYLFSRLRRRKGAPNNHVPLRMRAATNPGGEGHDWVKTRFGIADDGRRGRIDYDEDGRPKRCYVPSRLEDNPSLDQAEYEKSLEELDPITRAQLRRGDWGARPSGGLFQREWFIQPPQRLILDAPPPGLERVVRFWDLAASVPTKPSDTPDWTAGVKIGLKAGQMFVIDVQRFRATPKGVEDRIRQTAELDGRKVRIRMEQEPGSSGINTIDNYARKVLFGFDFAGVRSTGDKVERARPTSAAAEKGNLILCRGDWNAAYLDELVAFPYGLHDDQVDGTSGAHKELAERKFKSYRGELPF